MKKILSGLAILTLTGSIISPVLATINHSSSSSQEQSNIIDNENYKPYQAKDNWENYMTKNQGFINIIKNIAGLDSEYQYQGSDLVMDTIITKDSSQPIGTLLMNGKIKTTVGSPSMASQHIIDNSHGPNPITVNYDSKTVTNTSTVNASFSSDISRSITASAKVSFPFVNASVSTTLSFNIGMSNSTTSSVEQTVTFDKFATTINAGDKLEVDYLVMQNLEVFNMILKAKLNLQLSKFNCFNNSGIIKTITWSDLAKNKNNNQTFAQQISKSLDSFEIGKNMQPLLSVDKKKQNKYLKNKQAEIKYYLNDIFWDNNLINKIQFELSSITHKDGKGYFIYQSDTDNVISLDLSSSNIARFKGLNLFPNLTSLNISNNQQSINLVDLQLIFLKLEALNISNNSINDIDIVMYFHSLRKLYVSNMIVEKNFIWDSLFLPLSNITTLTKLDIKNNNVSDISSLSYLTNLTSLVLDSNRISDISSLSNLTKLIYLFLMLNNISDVSPLSNLTKTPYLILTANRISDISPLSNLINLETLYLSSNYIPNTDATWSVLHQLPHYNSTWDDVSVRNSQN